MPPADGGVSGGGLSSSSSSSGTSFVACAAAAAITAAVAAALHVVATRRLTERLTDRRLEERRGRIRAEVKLRTLMKEESSQRQWKSMGGGSTEDPDGTGGEAGAMMSSAPKGAPGSLRADAAMAARHDMTLRCIGTVVSPFTKRMGTPRQGALAPHSRGYIQLTVPAQTVEGMELYSHAWIVFAFHANTDTPDSRKTKIRPPRATRGTKVGMLATRSPHRPNSIGLSLVRMAGVDTARRRLHVVALDLVNGTPVYDVKPCISWDVPGYHDSARLSVPDWVSQEDTLQRVEFSDAARASLTRLVSEGRLSPLYTSENDPGAECAAATVREVLAQDPRAANRRGTVDRRDGEPYRMVFGSVSVCFVVAEGSVTVVGAEPMDFNGALYVDGVPLSAEGRIAEQRGEDPSA